MLYKFFVDDSGKKEYLTPYSRDFIDNPPLFDDYESFWWDNYFVLCGARIKQEDMASINKQINKLKQDCFGTNKVEVKSDWLRNPHQREKHYLSPFGITGERLNKFGNDFVDVITNNRDTLKIIATVFDKRYFGDAKRTTPDGIPLLKSTQVLLERLQYAGNYNLVVFDQMESSLKVTKGQQGKILNVFQDNGEMQNIFVEKYDAIVDINFKESKTENFLQVADICAYTIFRQFVEYGRDWIKHSGNKQLPAYDYFHRIRCNFHFHPRTGKVPGCGLVCLPDITKAKWDILAGCFKKTPQ